MNITHERASRYITAVREYVKNVGHATNAELIKELHLHYPELSATTVHRITARMLERGELQLAPNGRGKVLRFDANVEPHDHFMCERCDMLRDANIGDIVRPHIEAAIGNDCSISGSLTVSGICKRCNQKQDAVQTTLLKPGNRETL